MSRVLLIVGHDSAIRQFRATTIRMLRARGALVRVLVTGDSGDGENISVSMGATYRSLGISHHSKNPVSNLKLVIGIARQVRLFRPDSVLVRNAQGIAFLRWARLLSFTTFKAVAMVEGLGAAQSKAVRILWRLGFPVFDSVILLNPDDREDLAAASILKPAHRVILADGIGIEADRFQPHPMPAKGSGQAPWRIVTISRLIEEKGILTLLDAAEVLRARGRVPVRFDLIGNFTESSGEKIRTRLKDAEAAGLVNFHGPQSDVKPFLAAAHLHVLPGWYREGLPVTVMEAAAVGRASIVTSARAIRHAVTPDTGWHVPPKDYLALADCIENGLLSGAYETKGKAAQASAAQRFNRSAFDETVCGLLTVKQMKGTT